MTATAGVVEIEAITGGGAAEEVEPKRESDSACVPFRYRDPVTHSLGLLASTWESLHKAWQATEKRAAYGSPPLQKALTGYAESLRKLRDQVGAKMTAELKEHPVWPWLSTHPGVRGVHVARVISMIGDPLRFPGRMCPAGHHAPEDQTGPCLTLVDRAGKWEPCGEQLGQIRPGTGVRSLWHYLGLHVVEGRLARKKKGHQATWNPAGRTALLQPDGVADQIIKLRVAPWRMVYDAKKSRVAAERGAEAVSESDHQSGPSSAAPFCGAAEEGESATCRGPAALVQEGGADEVFESDALDGHALAAVCRDPAGCDREIELVIGRADLAFAVEIGSGPAAEGEGVGTECAIEHRAGAPSLRLIQIHQIARTVAVKAFVADLLVEWKRAVRQEVSQ